MSECSGYIGAILKRESLREKAEEMLDHFINYVVKYGYCFKGNFQPVDNVFEMLLYVQNVLHVDLGIKEEALA